MQYYNPKSEFVVTWCPVCDVQRQLHNIWYLFGKDENIGMFAQFYDCNKIHTVIGYYCYGCENVIYKNTTEGRNL